MKSNKKVSLLFLIFVPFVCLGQWSQLGSDIDGEFAGDRSGTSVSLNGDGTTLAVGAILNNDGANNGGQVRVFDWNGSSWSQKGADIDGTGEGDVFGLSVDISTNGNVVVVGAPSTFNPSYSTGTTAPGYARVYGWDGTNWIQRGIEIIGEGFDDTAGKSVSINADGTIIAIGAGSNFANGIQSGHTRIFQWNGTSWTQIGTDIDGESEGDLSGNSVRLNAAGTIVAIGATGNEVNGPNSGHVRIYEWNGSEWLQKGIDLDGLAFDRFGNSVSLDETGTTLSAGANGSTFIGYTKVYYWNGNNWIQKGTTIIGDTDLDFSGFAGSLNNDGNSIAIGAFGNNNGYARVYSFDGTDWVQQGSDILGEAEFDQFGTSISLSGNGTIVAIGGQFNDGNGNNSGHVRVYENLSTADIHDTESRYSFQYFPNPTNSMLYIKDLKISATVRLLSLDGKVILSTKINKNDANIDLRDLPSGIYILEIKSSEFFNSVKIIKEES
ncbi:MAG: hypothetical protein ACJA1C_000222 [Crocinitomicaceae bacterium]|jgi:hypothetical protein